jgi:AmmeMemoRadiSam system protein B
LSLRRPAVAGAFYPAGREELKQLIKSCYTEKLGPGSLPPSKYETHGVVACVSPHAGYVYSGAVAAHSYLHLSSLRNPELVVVVAPNHYGIGSGISAFREGAWETPLGVVSVDSKAAKSLAEITGIVDFDTVSHQMEHSLEVQLPFLQMIYGSFQLLPISLAFQDVDTTRPLGDGIAEMLRGRDALLVASSDFTHYEPAEVARKKDQALIRTVESLNVLDFYATFTRLNVTACGYVAIATLMQACSKLGFNSAELLKYANSGDTTGDSSSVVGYASIKFSR